MEPRPLLEGRQVTKYFGGLAALRQIDFQVMPGEVLGVIGPNGSGKTTLIDCLTRIQNTDRGHLFFRGADITRSKPYQVARMGLARTFQVIRVYRKLSVMENMLVSRQWRGRGLAEQLVPDRRLIRARASELLDLLMIGHLRSELAGELSVGQQRLLEIGMALMPDPDLLLLDEATAGVNPALVDAIKEQIRSLNRDQGKTFVLIEHNMDVIMDLCSRVMVLDHGEKLAEGQAEAVLNDPSVVEACLGPQVGKQARDVGQ